MFFFPSHPKLTPFLVFFLCSFPLHSQQQEIAWGTSFDFENVLTSDGSALLLSEFSIELGTFGIFEPDATNLDEWLDNWKVFDAIPPDRPDSNGVFEVGATPTASFGSSATLFTDRTSSSIDAAGNSFNSGEQAYVFVRNGDAPEGETEWLLYTSESRPDWVFPGAFDQELQWFLSDVDEVIWGAVNGGGANGELIGGGSFTDDTEDFYIRSQGFTAVPEPGTPFFFSLALSCLLWRREKGRSRSV